MLSLATYKIEFQDENFEQLNRFLWQQQYSQVFVLIDENTQQYCLPILQKALKDYEIRCILIQSGEQHKNLDTCRFIWQQLLDGQADRQAVLLNLGGGVIGDMGGFCASTYKRGIDFIQIPTTLLAQVDASVGGKLGIDFGMVKNIIGLFCNPKAVFMHSNFLKTLAKRQLYSGYAEIIKHSLIHSLDYWRQLRKISKLEQVSWENTIQESLRIKSTIVTSDPLERHIRKALNFGHTIGHAIESLSLETDAPLLHGEAIAIGMICEAYLSHKIQKLPLSQLEELTKYIRQIYNNLKLSEINSLELLQLIRQDKKNEHGTICFTLIPEIGRASININAPEQLILESLDYYRSSNVGVT